MTSIPNRPVKENPIDQVKSSFIDGAIVLLYGIIGVLVAFGLYKLMKLMKRAMEWHAKRHGRARVDPIAPTLDIRMAITDYSSRLRKHGVVLARIDPAIKSIREHCSWISEFLEKTEKAEEETESCKEAKKYKETMERCERELRELGRQDATQTPNDLHDSIDAIEAEIDNAAKKFAAAMKREERIFDSRLSRNTG